MSNDIKDAAVQIQVSREIITAHVQAAVMSVLAKDSGELVRAVVQAAMNQKRDGYSNTKTIWEEQLNAKIRALAEECFKAWLEEQKPIIERQLRAHFDGPKGKETIKQIVTKMTGALSHFKAYVALGKDE